MKLEDLEIYKLAREISNKAWKIYQRMDYQTKKIIGDQFIRSVDSVSANITEGFGRYHYLDKNKFNYNARGSLFESIHWTELLLERKIIGEPEENYLKTKLKRLSVKLNNLISITKKQAKK